MKKDKRGKRKKKSEKEKSYYREGIFCVIAFFGLILLIFAWGLLIMGVSEWIFGFVVLIGVLIIFPTSGILIWIGIKRYFKDKKKVNGEGR